MAEFAYQEPARMKLGREIYDRYCRENKQGNAVSLLSDAMTVLRQLGPAGLDVWIDLDAAKRGFLRHAWQENAPDEMAVSLKARQEDADTAWAEIEDLMQVLRCAKYLLSDAMTVLRQLGPAGLDVWIDLKGKDGERQFIRNGLDAKLSDSLKSRQQDMDTAWAEIEDLMQVLRCAKYYAKTQEKDE